jgi:hypothetical protein
VWGGQSRFSKLARDPPLPGVVRTPEGGPNESVRIGPIQLASIMLSRAGSPTDRGSALIAAESQAPLRMNDTSPISA